MRFLLDVNALVALGVTEHEFHGHMLRWVREQGFPSVLTCPITELGFVRVIAQVPAYGYGVVECQRLLRRIKTAGAFSMEFLADDQAADSLPAWARQPAQTTDGHLMQLAAAHGAVLATLDQRIPGAYRIP